MISIKKVENKKLRERLLKDELKIKELVELKAEILIDEELQKQLVKK